LWGRGELASGESGKRRIGSRWTKGCYLKNMSSDRRRGSGGKRKGGVWGKNPIKRRKKRRVKAAPEGCRGKGGKSFRGGKWIGQR